MAIQICVITALRVFFISSGQPESVEGIKPNDVVTAFGEKFSELHNDTLVAAHRPFMARSVAWLITGTYEPEMVTYQPGSVVRLERQVRPELLEGLPGDIIGHQYLKLV